MTDEEIDRIADAVMRKLLIAYPRDQYGVALIKTLKASAAGGIITLLLIVILVLGGVNIKSIIGWFTR